KTGKGLLPKAYETYSMKIVATTYAELLASKTFKEDTLETEVNEFINKYFEVLDIDTETATHAAKIMRENELNFATSIVAATAKAKSLKLLANDSRTFEKIEGVELLKL